MSVTACLTPNHAEQKVRTISVVEHLITHQTEVYFDGGDFEFTVCDGSTKGIYCISIDLWNPSHSKIEFVTNNAEELVNLRSDVSTQFLKTASQHSLSMADAAKKSLDWLRRKRQTLRRTWGRRRRRKIAEQA